MKKILLIPILFCLINCTDKNQAQVLTKQDLDSVNVHLHDIFKGKTVKLISTSYVTDEFLLKKKILTDSLPLLYAYADSFYNLAKEYSDLYSLADTSTNYSVYLKEIKHYAESEKHDLKILSYDIDADFNVIIYTVELSTTLTEKDAFLLKAKSISDKFFYISNNLRNYIKNYIDQQWLKELAVAKSNIWVQCEVDGKMEEFGFFVHRKIKYPLSKGDDHFEVYEQLPY